MKEKEHVILEDGGLVSCVKMADRSFVFPLNTRVIKLTTVHVVRTRTKISLVQVELISHIFSLQVD